MAPVGRQTIDNIAGDPVGGEQAFEAGDPTALIEAYLTEMRDGEEEAANALFSAAGAPDFLDRFGPARIRSFTVGEAVTEGAAGSIYATIPVGLAIVQAGSREPVSLHATITLRRVNDVPGATHDQLRWNFIQANFDRLADAPPR